MKLHIRLRDIAIVKTEGKTEFILTFLLTTLVWVMMLILQVQRLLTSTQMFSGSLNFLLVVKLHEDIYT